MSDPTCPVCGVLFPQARPDGRPQKYCAKACYIIAANDRARERSMAKPRKGLVPCDSCGVPCRRFGATAYCGAEACRKERNRRLSAAAYASDPGRQGHAQWRSDMRRKYGITMTEYQRLLEIQGQRCRICGEGNGVTPSGQQRRLAVDHDHNTGTVRGLLCTPCNLMLGYAKDRPHVLSRAAEYLTCPVA